jgi:hypothetical protein
VRKHSGAQYFISRSVLESYVSLITREHVAGFFMHKQEFSVVILIICAIIGLRHLFF